MPLKDAQDTIEKLINKLKKSSNDPITNMDILQALISINANISELIPEKITPDRRYGITTLRLDSDVAYNDTEKQFGGKFIYVIATRSTEGFLAYEGSNSSPLLTSSALYSLKLDDKENDKIMLFPNMKIKTNGFSKFYVTREYDYDIDLILVISDTDIIDYTPQINMPFVYSNGSGSNQQRPAKIDSNGIQHVAIIGPLGYQAAVDGAYNLQVKINSTVPQYNDSIQNKTLLSKTFDWTSSTTGGTIWTPASGKKFVITDIILSVTADQTITLFDNTDNTTYRIFKLDLLSSSGIVCNYSKPYISAATNNVLKITTTANGGYITVTGYEI